MRMISGGGDSKKSQSRTIDMFPDSIQCANEIVINRAAEWFYLRQDNRKEV
ncbi:MAG: hypothetical protein NZ777_01645 [Pseudomonadales bacterium]|nr:hypothetical protein [Pseudomonadales bacterium]